MSEQNGGAAFPGRDRDTVTFNNGMSLRDYFAGQALAGMTGKSVIDPIDVEMVTRHGGIAKLIADAAFEFADAMLAERAK